MNNNSNISLYTWNWGDGGYNQTYASSTKEALTKAKEICEWLFPSLKNLRKVGSEGSKAIENFWNCYSIFD